MAKKTTGGQIRNTVSDQSRARGLQRSMLMRDGYDALDESDSWEPQCGAAPGQNDLGPDDEADGDLLQDDAEEDDPESVVVADGAAQEDDADEEASPLHLRDVIGSRSPVVLLRLAQEDETIRACCTVSPGKPEARESLEELRLFVESRFRAGPSILSPDEWRQLLGTTPTTIPQRLLLLTRIAVAGNAKVVVEHPPRQDGTTAEKYQFTPNDRGLERYVGKFAALPDGTPFSLRLLLADNRGKKKEGKEDASAWSQLPWAIRLEVLQRILAAEALHGEAIDDDTFRGKLAATLQAMGLAIPRPSWDDVKNLRESLKRKNLGHLFPNARERQRAYNAKASPVGPENATEEQES